MTRLLNGFFYIPLFFGLCFGGLLLRARYAFDEWPRMSGNDPWALVRRAPIDGFSKILSYSSHIHLTYLLLGLFLIALLPTLLGLTVRGVKGKGEVLQLGLQCVGLIGALALLLYQGGRFLWWFLD